MRTERLYLQDILDSAGEIGEFILGIAKDEFLSNKMLQAAVLQKLMIIGEASSKLSADLKSRYSDVDWSAIVGARHIFVHAYFKVDWDVIWETVKTNIPLLRNQILEIIAVEYPN